MTSRKHATGYMAAARAFPLTNRSCDDCDLPAAERHHRDGDPTNNDPANLAFYCVWHHKVAHGSSDTHCRNGHPYTPDNLRIDKRGYRICKTCRRAIGRAYRHRL